MASERSRRIQELFEEACNLPPDKAAELVTARCADDPDTRAEALAILAMDRACQQIESKPLVEPRTDPLIGARVGPFRILKLLGEGGMGLVYQAEQDRPRRLVALKVIRSPAPSPGEVRRFEQEIQILAALSHPGIACLYQSVNWSDARGTLACFAMELVEGKPLLEFVEAGGLSARDRISLVAKIADAVQHAHDHRIIHRDLKPGNILITPEGQPKVLDFGIARFMEPDGHTYTGQVLGSPAYMSPEQAKGDADRLGPTTDVYALGLIAYRLLAGQLPYPVEGKSSLQATRIICEQDPLPIGAIRKELRGDVETITGKALEKDHQRRYPTAGDFADDLRRFLRNEPIRARPPTVAYVLSKFARRHKAVAAGAATTLLALVSGLILALIARSQTEAYARDLERRRWDIFDTPTRLLGSIDVKRLQEILDAPPPGVDARAVVDEVVLAPMVSQADSPDPDQLEQVAALKNAAANFYRDARQYPQAEVLYKAVIDIRTRQFRSDHPDIAAGKANLAYLYMRMGRSADAEALLSEAVPVLRQQTNPLWRPDVAAAMDTLARARLDLGRGEDAETLYRSALAIRRSLVPESDPDYAKALHNLGRCIDERGRHAEALPILERARLLLEAVLPLQDLRVSTARTSSAAAMIPLGQLTRAAALLDSARPALDHPMAAALLKDRIYRGLIDLCAARESVSPGQGFAQEAESWRTRYQAWKGSGK